MNSCSKLPPRLDYSFFNGNWKNYREALYNKFKKDFIDDPPQYLGKPVDIIHQQFFENKERSFWHIISSGDHDCEREPDLLRCESLPFARVLIDDEGNCESFKVWVKYHDKTKKDRHYIWCSSVNYMVVLEDRGEKFKLITAYNVMPYNKKRYQKDYETYIKTKSPI